MQETSIEVYNKIEASGVLSKKRLQVFGFVVYNPGCTAYDAEEAFNPRNRSTINARFSELVSMGLIMVIPGEFKVQHGNRHIVYKITGLTEPKPLDKRLTGPQKQAWMLATLTKIMDMTGKSVGCPTCEEVRRLAGSVVHELTSW